MARLFRIVMDGTRPDVHFLLLDDKGVKVDEGPSSKKLAARTLDQGHDVRHDYDLRLER